MPKLSIITINLNNREGLKTTIESVRSQTSREFEHIIIDGGSTDGSADLIQANASNLGYWVSEKDNGLYSAMNKGIVVARGEYCQFLNSGDWLANENVIENLLKSLSSSSIHYGNMLKKLSNGRVIRDKCVDNGLSMFTFYKGSLNHSSALIKKALFEKYGLYDESLKIVSDWKFFLIAIGLYAESVSYIDLDVTYFDMTGISNSSKKLEYEERRKVLTEYLPQNILLDYDKYKIQILTTNRLNKYWFARKFIKLLDRSLFHFEKITRRYVN